MNYGLLERDLENILNAIKSFKEIEKAMIFGSRALGNYKKGSDIDIAIFGEKVNFNIVSKLNSILNEDLPIPYFVDITDYNTISNTNLIAHIDKFGAVIFDINDM